MTSSIDQQVLNNIPPQSMDQNNEAQLPPLPFGKLQGPPTTTTPKGQPTVNSKKNESQKEEKFTKTGHLDLKAKEMPQTQLKPGKEGHSYNLRVRRVWISAGAIPRKTFKLL